MSQFFKFFILQSLKEYLIDINIELSQSVEDELTFIDEDI